MPARPKLGQHFLHDASVLGRIVRAARIAPDTAVVEIGPGQGALTKFLLEAGAFITAVELDRGLAGGLRTRFGGNRHFRLIEGDVLKVDWNDVLPADGKAVVVGNLPYYITSPILRRVLPLGHRVSHAVFLIQKEVAERVVARKGSRDYGYLSALCRLWSEPEYLFTVRPGSFRPPPKVDSAAVRLQLRPESRVSPALVSFLEAAFRHPRKTLLNNLATLYSRERISALPEMKLRAQQLDVEELQALHERIETLR